MDLPFAQIIVQSHKTREPRVLPFNTVHAKRINSAISTGENTYQSVLLGTLSGIQKRTWFLAKDEITLAHEQVKRIRVLENQSGYSYYDNYSSRPEGEIPEVPVVLEWYDYSSFMDTYSVEKTRLVEKYDSIEVRDPMVYRGGRMNYYYGDFIEMQEKFAERHGLWNFTYRDDLSVQDSGERHGIWAVKGKLWKNWWGYGDWIEDLTNTQFKDQVSFEERGYINVERAYDSVQLYEPYEQTGKRVQFATDGVTLFERTFGNRTSLVFDQITLTESYLVQGRRVRLVADEISMVEGDTSQHGIRAYVVRDTVTMQEGAYSKHGLSNYRYREEIGMIENTPPFLRTVRDEFIFTEPAYQNGKRAWVYEDKYTVTDALVNDTPTVRETWLADDNWFQQTGKRVFVYQDLIGYADGGILNTTTPVRLETVQLLEGVIRNGRVVLDTRSDLVTLTDSYRLSANKTAVRTDSITITERIEIHGKMQKRQNDLFLVQDYMVFNRPFQQETYTLDEQYLPFRFDWRDKYYFTEEATIQKYKSYSTYEEISVLDRAALNDRFTVDIVIAEDISLEETYSKGGLTNWYRTERLDIAENYYYPVQASPYRRDDITLQEQYSLHGRISKFAEDSVTTDDAYRINGRRNFKASDAARAYDYLINIPKSPLVRDTFTVRDTYDYLPPQYEYVVMKEQYVLEDIVDRIRMIDSYYLSNREFVQRDTLYVVDSSDNKSGLDLGESIYYSEKRFNLRENLVPKHEEVVFTEKHKLFKKSDFLDVQPVIYTDRSNRYRSAVRVLADPSTGTHWAVWLDVATNTVQFARKPYTDSWRTHSRTSIELPDLNNKRSVTLDFTDAEPVPVVEADGRLYKYNGSGWTYLGRGWDVATDPVSGQIVYMSGDRKNVVGSDGSVRYALNVRARLVQSYSGSEPGLYVVDDLNRLIKTLGTPPARRTELEEEIASVRWEVTPATGSWIPVEGTVIIGGRS